LQKRGRDNREEINIRLSLAMSEISHYDEYKYVLVNDKISITVNNLIKIINYHILVTKMEENIKKLKIF
jgi:Guanylate kinase